MKKKLLICVISALALLALILGLVQLSGRTEPLSEQTVQGVVIDRAMGKVREEDFRGWAYISLELENGSVERYWFSRALARRGSDAELGDTVRVETAIEASTGLPVVTKITVLEE